MSPTGSHRPSSPARDRPPRRDRPVFLRRAALLRRRTRRLCRRVESRLALFGGWTWVAAGSLIGFEMLDLVFGTFLLAPELVPLVIVALALAWYFREWLRRAWQRVHAWRSRRRLRHPHRGPHQ